MVQWTLTINRNDDGTSNMYKCKIRKIAYRLKFLIGYWPKLKNILFIPKINRRLDSFWSNQFYVVNQLMLNKFKQK